MYFEFLIEENQHGKIGSFHCPGGSFLDVWGPYLNFLGTCETLTQAHEMQGRSLNPQDNPQDVLKST